MYKDLSFIRDVYKNAKPGDPICNSKENTTSNLQLNYDVLKTMGAFSNYNSITNFNDLSSNFYNELQNLCWLKGENCNQFGKTRICQNYKVECDIEMLDKNHWETNNGKQILKSNRYKMDKPDTKTQKCNGNDDIWKDIQNINTDDNYINVCRGMIMKWNYPNDNDINKAMKKHKTRIENIKTSNNGTLLLNSKIPAPPFESRGIKNHKLLWNNAKNNEYNNSDCVNDNITNVMEYNKNMSNVYKNKISDSHKKSYKTNNNALYNQSEGSDNLEPPKPIWLDMNFLSCGKDKDQELAIGQRVMAKFENYHPFKSGWMGATIVAKNPENKMEYGIRWNDSTDDKDEITEEWNWRNIGDLKIGASWYINNRNNLDTKVNDEKSERGLIPNLVKNDSDLEQTNLFTGFSDKILGCKFKNNNGGRYTYEMDWLRLDGNGKLKYGFTPEEISTKRQKLLRMIKDKKSIQILFLTSISLLFFYLMIKIKNKK